jgi:PPOX class probable F420-dependent enzyme
MPRTPRLEHADFDPAYGISAEVPDVSWEEVAQKLEASRNYWVASTRANGRPHAVPVWGLWLDGDLLFSTGRGSVTGRNVAHDPRVSVHLESGDDVVIIEGTVAEVAEADVLERWVEAYDAKYAFRPDPSEAGNVTYRVVAQRAYTWLERDFLNSVARWRFEE